MVSGVGLLIYVFLLHEEISRRVVRHQNVFLAVIALVILGSGLIYQPRRILVRALWAVVAPVVAVTLASAALELVRFIEVGHLTEGISIADRFFTMALFPYFLTYAWVLSLVLLVLGEIDHRVIKR
jgi:hypothetical protein